MCRVGIQVFSRILYQYLTSISINMIIQSSPRFLPESIYREIMFMLRQQELLIRAFVLGFNENYIFCILGRDELLTGGSGACEIVCVNGHVEREREAD